MPIRVNPWPVFVALLTLAFAGALPAQDNIFDPTESYRATDDYGNTTRITPSALGGFNATDSEGNVTRIRPSALGGYTATDSEGNVTRIRPSALGGYNATDSEGNVTRIRPSALGGYNATDSEGNTTRIKPTGFGSRSSYDRAAVDADDSVSSSLGPVVPSSPPYAYSRHSPQATGLPVGCLAKPRLPSQLAAASQARLLSRGHAFELHEVHGRCFRPLREVQHLDTDNLVGLVEVENDSRRNFLGLDDLRIIEPQVKRIGFSIHIQSHAFTTKSPATALRIVRNLSART